MSELRPQIRRLSDGRFDDTLAINRALRCGIIGIIGYGWSVRGDRGDQLMRNQYVFLIEN